MSDEGFTFTNNSNCTVELVRNGITIHLAPGDSWHLPSLGGHIEVLPYTRAAEGFHEACVCAGEKLDDEPPQSLPLPPFGHVKVPNFDAIKKQMEETCSVPFLREPDPREYNEDDCCPSPTCAGHLYWPERADDCHCSQLNAPCHNCESMFPKCDCCELSVDEILDNLAQDRETTIQRQKVGENVVKGTHAHLTILDDVVNEEVIIKTSDDDTTLHSSDKLPACWR